MDEDILLLLLGAGIGFLSTLLVEFVKRFLDDRRMNREREHEEVQLRELNLRKFIETDDAMKKAPLAWLKLYETTSVPRYMLHSETTENLSTFTRLFTRSRRSFHKNGEYRVIEKIVLGRTQLIGRGEDCEISLEDLSASRLHAMIRYDGNDYILYDLGSTTGTFVNGERVPGSGIALSHRDKVSLGRTSFGFERADLERKKRKYNA